MDELKPCPFCGSESVYLDAKSKGIRFNGLDMRVERCTYSVRCNKCHARGGTAGGKIILNWDYNANPFTGEPLDDRGLFELPAWATTSGELREKAIEAWNRRAENAN